jgi:N-acyl-D-amino-acid deacylase
VDLVIKGASVYDGSGGRPTVADVAVTAGRIEAVGDLAQSRSGVDVEASGLALAPGFIDVHSHDDFAVFVTPELAFKVGQGVTTVVVGNCGFGAAPFESARPYLAFLGADGASLPAWSTYGEYLDAVDADPPGVNVAVLVGLGAVRSDAMGSARRAAGRSETGRMLHTLASALEAGCVGCSTGLVYEPGRYSSTDELVALARKTAEAGGVYASHLRDEGDGLLGAVGEAVRVGEESGVSVQISHHKASGRSAWGLVASSLTAIEHARTSGIDVTADQYPYTAGSTTLSAVLTNHEDGGGMGTVDWNAVVLASAPGHPAWEGRALAELAASSDLSPAEVAARIVDAEDQAAVVIITSMCEDDVRTVLAHPTTMIGSDGIPSRGGRPHPRLYGTFARVLGHYVRDDPVLSLEQAVHRMTGLPAAKFALAGRGTISPGAHADLVLFDPATVDDVATYRSPRRHPSGIRGVWVNGTAVVRDGDLTGERPGRALRSAPLG